MQGCIEMQQCVYSCRACGLSRCSLVREGEGQPKARDESTHRALNCCRAAQLFHDQERIGRGRACLGASWGVDSCIRVRLRTLPW